jgi:hypothetical protein
MKSKTLSPTFPDAPASQSQSTPPILPPSRLPAFFPRFEAERFGDLPTFCGKGSIFSLAFAPSTKAQAALSCHPSNKQFLRESSQFYSS